MYEQACQQHCCSWPAQPFSSNPAGQLNHIQDGQLNHVQAGQLNHVQDGQLNHVQAVNRQKQAVCFYVCSTENRCSL